MNHKAIVVKQMNEEAARLRSRLAELEAGIRVLGGSVSPATSSIQKRRNRGKSASGAGKAAQAHKSAAVTEVLHPDLQAQLNAIKANTKLTPIQKAQESRKARAAFAKASAALTRPEGAVLGEAAAG